MPKTKKDANRSEELEALRTKLSEKEQQMSKLLKFMTANSDYRNDIIWLADDINKLQKRIKELE